ncbi:type II secretion system F family protein [Mitsuokella sp.]|uniref:type II secretion system F family protein n=1 Tax=Mitsuokella sp. TaxID=2049034 RepID=UPI002A81DC7E|nr:type II secretion system F family protein [Mitsuokella sp.]MDY4474822.1 type II secretion system F family protein [Mitsuokella sp.]
MLKVLFAISLTAIIFLVFFGIIRSIVQPKSAIRKRMASLETLDEANDPFAVPAYEAVSTAQSAEKTGGFAKTMEELASHLVPKGLHPIIQKRLVLAGKAREWSVAEFFGSCLLGALVMWLFATVLVRGGSWAPIQKTMIVFLLGILGGLMPVVFLNTTIDRRQKQIERQLPQVLDLLCVSVQAGLSFDAALAKITARMKGPFIDECRRLQEDIRMGVVRRTAMRALADRCGLEDVSLFMTSIIQAERLGTSMGKTLKNQADNIRERRRQYVKAQAMKAPVKIVFPLVLFIFPAIFVVTLVPSLLYLLKNL